MERKLKEQNVFKKRIDRQNCKESVDIMVNDILLQIWSHVENIGLNVQNLTKKYYNLIHEVEKNKN